MKTVLRGVLSEVSIPIFESSETISSRSFLATVDVATGNLEQVQALSATAQEARLHARPHGQVAVFEAENLHIEPLGALHVRNMQDHVIDSRHL